MERAGAHQSAWRSFRKTVGGWIAESIRREELLFVGFAALVGLATGLAAVGFNRLLVLGVQVFFGHGPLEEVNQRLPWFRIMIAPIIGGLFVGPVIHWLARETKGHGVPEVIDAVVNHGGRIRARVAAVKLLVSTATITSGGSVGREGPIVQIGSSLGSFGGQFIKLGAARLKVLVACGAAAGIAASFNAPIAGALFAAEIIVGSGSLRTFSPILVSSMGATIVSRAILGREEWFHIPTSVAEGYQLVSGWEVPMYLVLGLLVALVAVLFITAIYAAEDYFESLPVPPYLLPALGGLFLGILGIFFPRVLSVGYGTIFGILSGNLDLTLVAALVFVKILATSLSLGSGGSGGVFSPSLFIGASLGGAFGIVVHALFPGYTAASGAYALVGMGTFVAATTQAPLMAIIMMFELTRRYEVILPMMLACAIGTLVATRLKRESIYTLKLLRRGAVLQRGAEAEVVRTHRVKDVMRSQAETFHPSVPFESVLAHMLAERVNTYYVIDESGTYLGQVTLEDMKNVLNEPAIARVAIAVDLMDESLEPVYPEQSLSECMRRFAGDDLDQLPVVDKESGVLLGIVTRRDIFVLYNREVLRQHSLGLEFVQEDGGELLRDFVEVPEDHAVETMKLTERLAGRTLRELNIRARYGVNVIALRAGETASRPDRLAPDPDRPLEAGIRLVVAGPREGIDELRSEIEEIEEIEEIAETDETDETD